MKLEKIYFYIKVLSVVGIVLALYLLMEQALQRPVRPCTVNSTVNCDAIVSGAVSKTLGLPTPLYGLIGYVVILLSAFRKKSNLLFAMAAFGLVFCLRITVIELTQLHVVCPVCLLCQIIMIVVFSLSVILKGQLQKNDTKASHED